jgi:hypothetical protein
MAVRFLFEEKLLDKISKEKQRISLSDVHRFSTLEALCHYFDYKLGNLIVLESDNRVITQKHPQPIKREVAP